MKEKNEKRTIKEIKEQMDILEKEINERDPFKNCNEDASKIDKKVLDAYDELILKYNDLYCDYIDLSRDEIEENWDWD